jgi:hypothetical protein
MPRLFRIFRTVLCASDPVLCKKPRACINALTRRRFVVNGSANYNVDINAPDNPIAGQPVEILAVQSIIGCFGA